MAELIFYRRSEELMRVGVGASLTVGRGPSNDVLVPDPSVSRQQFRIEKNAEGFVLKDLSGRGTEVGGEPRNEVVLDDGIDVGLGQWRAVFSLTAAGFGDAETQQFRSGDTIVQPRDEHEAARVLPARLRIRADGRDESVNIGAEMTIGSDPACDVVLQDNFVSAAHARIERRGNTFLLHDLESRNGTFIGAIRVHEAELPFGCPLRIGSTELVIVRAEQDKTSSFEGMVGSDASMRKVFDTVDRVAPSCAAVSIFGETGTGKELVARALHNRSTRASGPFVPVNCGALSKELIESELFGHEKGAFTGAERLRKGAFEEADGGTLFLDEIGELPLELQAKLLRALELGEVKRVGATRPMNVDVRLVAATNRDLRAEAKKGAFREDLYWRLCVVPIQLPPLRARRGDVRALVHHFLTVFAPSGATVGLSPAAEEKLLGHDWPGNVRELKNAIHRSMLLRRSDIIEPDDITFDRDLEFSTKTAEGEGGYDPDVDDNSRVYIMGKSLESIEDEVFMKTVRRIGARASFVARARGQARGAVYRRMEKLGISPAGGEQKEAEE